MIPRPVYDPAEPRTPAYYEAFAAAHGFVINPQARKGILMMLDRRTVAEGRPFCPCRPGNVEESNICPCTEFCDTGYCHCNFFVRQVMPAPDELDSVKQSKEWEVQPT